MKPYGGLLSKCGSGSVNKQVCFHSPCVANLNLV